MSIETFQLPYSERAVEDLRDRLARTRWPDTIPDSGWEYGFDLEYLRRICRYWREEFDWKAEIERLKGLQHLRYRTGDQLSILFTSAGVGLRRFRYCCSMAGRDRFWRC